MRAPLRSGMLGRGRGDGGRGGRGGGRGDGGRGGGRGGRGGFRDEGPPDQIVEAGNVLHECESELVCKWSVENKVPYFNAGVYLENKRKIGKIDEILGKISEVFFTVKMDPGVVAKSFQKDDVVYIGTDKLLPLARFTNPPKESGGRGGRTGRGDGRGGGRGGGRGFSPSGRGAARGGGRGGSFGRGGGGGRTFSGGRSAGRGGGRGGRGRF